jgi:hypothetical protein
MTAWMPWRTARIWLLVLAFISAMGGHIFSLASSDSANESGEDVSEYDVKAAYLYNFAKFVEWPSDAFAGNGAPVRIGILGNDLFCSLLDDGFRDKKVNERPLAIRCVGANDDLRTYQILFVSSTQMQRMPQILAKIQTAPVLLVTECTPTIPQGSIINFVWEGKKIRFEVDNANAEKARLKISSKLLVLARNLQHEGKH